VTQRLVGAAVMQIFFSSLACLPGPHVTDVGLVDGTTGDIIASVAVTT
jgi:adenine deaminase